MSNAERLLRELRQSGRRGCTHRELESAGVSYVSVEVERACERGAVIREDRLPVSRQKRYVLLVEPDVGRAAASPPRTEAFARAADVRSAVFPAKDGGSSQDTGKLFDPPPAPVASPYDEAA